MTASATPRGPPLASRPRWQAMITTRKPKISALPSDTHTSAVEVNEPKVAQ
ncbi:Uncharacterised protein [Mycobacteroides abscessus subsp. abscessus]|nr:Uncharacterised protein [Mycobacteroides abscessus subsp. abscessus]